MNHRLPNSILLSVAASVLAGTAAFANADALVDQAVSEINAGKVDRAIPLLIQALKEDDKNGKAHYYLGQALKQMGQKEEAASQLELAVKLLPEGMLNSLAKQVVANPSAAISSNALKPNNSWWDNMVGSVQSSTATFWKMLPGQSSLPATSSGTTSNSPKTQGLFTFQMPDITAGVRDAYNNTRKAFRHDEHRSEDRPGSNSAAKVISMGLMQELASSSREADLAGKVSQKGGVDNFPEAPEFVREWDQWIFRFRRIINIVLTRHLLREAKDEKTGTANVIFSLDKNGNLKGCIYSGTASDTLNNSLLQTIRDVNHASFLKFPAMSRITGWNFRMQWDFGQLLTYIDMYRQREAQIRMLAQKQAEMKTSAKIKSTQQASLSAHIKKLPPPRPQVAHTPPPVQVKTGVAGMVLPKPKPTELKAHPLRLSDLIGRNTPPPPDMQDVVDAMNLDMEYEMSEEMQQQAVTKPGNQPAEQPTPPATKPIDGNKTPVEPTQ